MEKCRNLTPCTLELLDDPALKTTAANYDFKYVPGEQFQKVIRTVQRDRLKHKKDSIWSEFCHYKRRPTIINVKEKDSISKYEVKSHQDHRNIIKTKTSTIKIISTPMVENKSDNQDSPSPEESYRTYKVPKVRIMTDEEIKNVVESAFKEVMEQTGNSQIVNQLQTSRQEKKKPDGERVETIPEKSFEQQPTTLPEGGETPQISARSIKTSRSINTARSMKTARSSVLEDVSQEITSPSIDLMEDLHSSPYYETNTEVVQLVKVSARSQLSTRSIDSSKTIETSKSSERTSELDEQDTVSVKSEDGEIILGDAADNIVAEDKVKEEKKRIPDISIVPELTCIERDELRKFLGVEEYILSSEINVDRFDEETNSSSEDDGNEKLVEEKEPNIQPLVRIRQPTPRRVMLKLEEDVIIKPIKSSSTIQKKSARIAESPRKRVPLSARVNTPRINKESHVKSPEKSSKVSLIPLRPSPAVTPRTPKKKKNASTAVISDIRQHELKQENILLMAKIMGYLQKITQTIERIRDNLDDIPEPDGNLDLKRRERRAEEFTARFARNYLYQISRLMEEIRVIPKEQCLSKSDNDFPTKVCNLFSTLNQAIQSYMKHMSSFIVDQNPKKLGTLLEVITEATKLCVHKKILEKADAAVHEVLRKAKSLKTYLNANQEKALQIPQLKQKKAKSQKPQKGEADAPKPARKLSMYDTIPANLAATKRKSGHSLKGTARSKTSIRSLMPKSSCDSRAAFHKSEKRMNQKIASTRVPSKPSLPSPAPHPARIEESESKEDELSIESPHIDNVNTQIETVRSEDMQDELTPKSGENLVKDIIANVNEGQNIDSMHSAERDKDINNTVIEALESITKQQVQQILGPLMSNLGAFVSNKAGTAGVDINAILNGLITSQISGAVVGSTGPLASGWGTFNQQEQNGSNFNNGQEIGTNFPLNVNPQTYDNNANCERELAVQNRQRIHQPQPRRAAPAPNAFSAGELNNNNDDMVTPSQPEQQQTGPTSDTIIGDTGALVAGSRARTGAKNKYTEECRALGQDEGGDFGASKSESETKKVQQLRYERNVQFTFVTAEDDNERNDGDPKHGQKHGNHESNMQQKQPSDDKNIQKELNKLRKDRLHFIEQIADNPLYVNEHFSQPWKVISKIAKQIVDDAIDDVERSINFGEETFVRDFIQMELES